MRSSTRVCLASLLMFGCSGTVGESTIGDPLANGPAQNNSPINLTGLGTAGSSAVPPLEGDACVTGVVGAVALPSVLQMVVDTSGSMQWPPGWDLDSSDDPPTGTPSKWEITQAALHDTVSTLSRETALGVSFFPNIAHMGTSCIKNEIALPIDLLGTTPSKQRELLDVALAEADPRGGTPTHAAFRFGMQTLGLSRIRGNRFLLLITDGVPTYTLNCSGDGRNAVDSAPLIADAAAMRAEGVLTFVIGSPGSEDARKALSRLALAGGTARAGCSADGPNYCHFDMTQEHDLGTALRGALSSITSRITSCEYPIPAPPAGQVLDNGRVNVVFRPALGASETIPRDSGTRCDDGWQYSADGKRIVLCGASCERVQNSPEAEVQVLFGCETRVSPPR